MLSRESADRAKITVTSTDRDTVGKEGGQREKKNAYTDEMKLDIVLKSLHARTHAHSV